MVRNARCGEPSHAAHFGAASHAGNAWELLRTFVTVADIWPYRWAGCKRDAGSCVCDSRPGCL